MTLLYFDGFDLHTRVLSGLDVGAGAMQDAGYYWRGGTITGYDFPVGYQSGRSMRVTTSGTNDAGGIGLRGFEGRVGFWGIWNATSRSLDVVRFERSGWLGRFRSNTDRTISLVINGVDIATSPSVMDNTWAYFEFYGNAETGVWSLHRNGFPLIQVDNAPTIPAGRNLSFHLGNPSLSSTPNFRVDHLWVTNGPFPEGNEILGVQVVAAVDKYNSNADGFVGSLVLGGERYQSGFRAALVASQSGYGGGRNLANVLNYQFVTDPSTGLPWSRAAFDAIEKWGICYVTRLGGPARQRVVGMMLATLEYNNGQPLVVNRPVGGAAEFSGPWVRSDPTKSFAWHLQEAPRLSISLAANTPSLYADGPGCALFPGPGEVPVPVRPEFTDVGVTFAEEFREDYTDWVRIDGVGADYESEFTSGYGIYGDGNRKFQSNYVTVNYEHVPTGGAYIQGLWDYTLDPDTGRWSMKQNIYKQEDGFRHGTRRLKIRGHGKTLQLRVSSKAGQPFKVNGWTILVTSNTSV